MNNAAVDLKSCLSEELGFFVSILKELRQNNPIELVWGKFEVI